MNESFCCNGMEWNELFRMHVYFSLHFFLFFDEFALCHRFQWNLVIEELFTGPSGVTAKFRHHSSAAIV